MESLFFFDDWRLHAREGMDRRQGRPEQVKEIKLGRHPELSIIRGVSNIRYDDCCGCYVTYVDCHHSDDRARFVIQLETDDPYDWPTPQWASGSGPLWTRTEKAVVDQNGNPLSCFNVLPLAGTPLADKGYFMNLASHSDYKAITAFSQDGLHFELNHETHWLDHFSDTGNSCIYNPQTDQYMIFCRPEFVDRRVAQVTSTDLRSFSPETVVLQPDAEDPVCREFYGLAPILYDDLFVGILSIYDTEPTEKSDCKMQGTNEMQLAYSYNGQNWYRASRQAFIPRTEPGNPLGGCVYAGAPFRTPENRLLFGVMGSWGEHNAGPDLPKELNPFVTYLYEMRLDGFVYLKTRARQGLVRTKTVLPQGGELTVNARTTPSGYVKVAVLEEKTHKPVPNYTLEDSVPITGDELFGKVCWQRRDNLDELKDRPVMLEVHVREGELYALRFSHQVKFGTQPHERI